MLLTTMFLLGTTKLTHAVGTLDDEPPHMHINYGHDWVHVSATPSVPVKVGLNNTAYVEGTTGKDGLFRSYEWIWTPDEPHLEPGDIVTAWINSEVIGVVEVGEIKSVMDFDADFVSGTINAPWLGSAPVTVICDIWEEIQPDPIEIEAVAADGTTALNRDVMTPTFRRVRASV
jgi:hypothetical protein